MNHLEMEYNWLDSPQAWVSLKHEGDKVIVFERAGLLFVFNFHPTNSFQDYRVGVDVAGEYKIVLSSDDKQYGGFENVDVNTTFVTTPLEWNGRKNWLQVGGLLHDIAIRSTHHLPSGLYSFPNKHSPCESLGLKSVLRVSGWFRELG
jgi:1,4-alpha-glucan branching enzyme